MESVVADVFDEVGVEGDGVVGPDRLQVALKVSSSVSVGSGSIGCLPELGCCGVGGVSHRRVKVMRKSLTVRANTFGITAGA